MTGPPTESVLGFAFVARDDGGPARLPWVALILKDHPEWARGRLNGIGGKVEAPEEPRAAMAREFREEAGVKTAEADWRLVAHFGRAAGHTVYVYTTTLPKLVHLKADGPEPCSWVGADYLPQSVLPNLRWLIPLCLDDRVADPVAVAYRRPAADPPPAPEAP